MGLTLDYSSESESTPYNRVSCCNKYKWRILFVIYCIMLKGTRVQFPRPFTRFVLNCNPFQMIQLFLHQLFNSIFYTSNPSFCNVAASVRSIGRSRLSFMSLESVFEAFLYDRYLIEYWGDVLWEGLLSVLIVAVWRLIGKDIEKLSRVWSD